MQTITHRVRTFLSEQGATIEPWSGLDTTYAELYSLLDRRRDDPGLWGPLEELLRQVQKQATDPDADQRLAAPAAELLSSWDAAELVTALRQALPGATPSGASPATETGEYRSLTRRLSPSVLGAFLAIGIAAAGCTGHYDADRPGSGGGGTGSGGGGGTGGGGAGGVGTGGVGGGTASCVIDDAVVLTSTINDSTLPDASKASLCACMTQLSQSWRDGLTALFETGTPDQIATALEEILRCCTQGLTSGNFSQSTLLLGTLCDPFTGSGGMFNGSGGGVIYKGVSFPD